MTMWAGRACHTDNHIGYHRDVGRGGIRRRKPRPRQPRRKTASSAPLEFEGTALGRYSGLALGPFVRGLARARRRRRPGRRWDPLVVTLVAIIILVLVGPLILFLLRSA